MQKAAQIIKQSQHLIILSGAGIGVDSGLPDFRGAEGFWKAYPPLMKAGIVFTQAANPSLFRENPSLAWGFYGHRYQLYKGTKPHIGFDILKK